jgi:hypothetical protein
MTPLPRNHAAQAQAIYRAITVTSHKSHISIAVFSRDHLFSLSPAATQTRGHGIPLYRPVGLWQPVGDPSHACGSCFISTGPLTTKKYPWHGHTKAATATWTSQYQISIGRSGSIKGCLIMFRGNASSDFRLPHLYISYHHHPVVSQGHKVVPRSPESPLRLLHKRVTSTSSVIMKQ